MYAKRCEHCGAYLDPCEPCDCSAETEKMKKKYAALLHEEQDGQMRLEMAGCFSQTIRYQTF